MKLQRLTSLLGLSLFASLAGCSNDGDAGSEGPGLRMAVLGEGVDGFHYTVTRVSCDGEPIAEYSAAMDVALRVGQTLPGNLASFIGRPFAEGSNHSFADAFFTLPAGCYDVEATPMGEGAETCAKAALKGVEVFEGQTTERLMISQCLGTDLGALDAIAALNHDPKMEKVWFPESKFSCAEAISLCVAASDEDGDPLRLSVTFDDGVPCAAGEFVEGCTSIVCTAPGSYVPHVAVFDQAYDEHGALVDIETLLATFGSAADSRAELDAQLHVDGVTGYWDHDHDTFGGDAAFVCTGTEEDFVTVAGDCNDADGTINPDAVEVCDGVDNDCDGEIDEDTCLPSFTVVQTAETYSGSEVRDELQAVIDGGSLLSHTEPVDLAGFKDNNSMNEGHAYRISIPFHMEADGVFGVRFGADFGGGGALFLDGNFVTKSTEDLWWNHNWANTADVLAASGLAITAGVHEIEIYGFEYCCMGSMTFEIDRDNDGTFEAFTF